MKLRALVMLTVLSVACGTSQNRGKTPHDAGSETGRWDAFYGGTGGSLAGTGGLGGTGGRDAAGQTADAEVGVGETGRRDAGGQGGSSGATGGGGGTTSRADAPVGGETLDAGGTTVTDGRADKNKVETGSPPEVNAVDSGVETGTDLAVDLPAASPDTPADGPVVTCTTEGEIRCGSAGVETCTSGVWLETQSCPQGCAAGRCNTGQVQCNPGEVACFASSVKVCNATGSAWLASMVCADHCENGLCVGTCTPGASRCNGNTRQVCNANGSAWTDAQACTLGCQQSVCVEGAHANQGNVETLEGPHVYQGCFSIELGGSVSVPAGKTLEIWATCFRTTAGTTVSLGSAASFIVHASDTIDLAGAINGGALVKLAAGNALEDAGSISSASIILRADRLGYRTGASVTGTAAALYGASIKNEASFPGTISVMPPDSLSSVTAPDTGWWNLPSSGLDISWPRPFPGVAGYYVSIGDGVPGPGNGTLTTREHATLDAGQLAAGPNRIRVVSVNSTSTVGTYPVDLNVIMNIRPPIVTSSSHAVQGQWYSTPDLFLSWVDPVGAPAGTFTGYRFIIDHEADSLPTATTGTFTTQKQILLPGMADGIWYFHIVNVDRLGRTTPAAAHYQVRIGSAPANGNLAGHIESGGVPLAGVHVSLNGGLLDAYTSATGDYSFQDQVPALALPYTVRATLAGYASATAQVQVRAQTTTIKNFTMTTAAGTVGYQLGREVPMYTGTVPLGKVTFAMGPRDEIIWASIGNTENTTKPLEAVIIAHTTGEELGKDTTVKVGHGPAGQGMDVGWDGSRFYALDNYACVLAGYGRSCLQLHTYDVAGQRLASSSSWDYGGQETVYSTATAWSGASFGVFSIQNHYLNMYSTARFRELTSSLAFASDGIYLRQLSDGLYSQVRSTALWDGTGYGLLYQSDHCYFARYDVDHEEVVAPVDLAQCRPSADLSLVFDGTDHHATYVTEGQSNALILRSITREGTAGVGTTVADLGANGTSDPSLSFDRRNLLLAYSTGAAGPSVLEVRAPGDHSLVKSIDLGMVTNPLVHFNLQTNQGGIVYVKNGALYFRGLQLE